MAGKSRWLRTTNFISQTCLRIRGGQCKWRPILRFNKSTTELLLRASNRSPARKLATSRPLKYLSNITRRERAATLQYLAQSDTQDLRPIVMIALGLLVFSSTTLLASACTDWKSMDLKKPDIPPTDNTDVFYQDSQSVDVQVIT